jgi:hypothetical protein
LERIYKYPKFKDFLGITFDKEKRLCGEVDIEEFKKGYAKIVSDIVLEKIDSRKLNSVDAMDNYLKSLDDFMPDKSRVGAFADLLLNRKFQELNRQQIKRQNQSRP